MPTQFQRPIDLPKDIPIYHTAHRDNNADLLLKVTALESDETGVFPVFKEDMVEYLPNYFGMIFDKNKGYEFRENRLQKGEYFEIGIPNLKDPKMFGAYLYNLVYSKTEICKMFSSNQLPDLDFDDFDKTWCEFYWIANYFGEDDAVEKTRRVLSNKYKDIVKDWPWMEGYFGVFLIF